MTSNEQVNWKGVPDNIDDLAGFVYVVTNKVTGQKYIDVSISGKP
jgi:hypothetical protein